MATTTNTSPTGAQVFVFGANGELFQPAGGHSPAWPRYNQLAGAGNDVNFNQVGNHGYGAYGENVAIGNIDDDSDLEIITTFDNHQINAFNLDGTSILASPWFTNRESDATGRRMGWGQFIRWADPQVERRHYHLHTGAWPSPEDQTWLQWTASPPAVADLDGDGRNEVVGLPNAERHIPYRTQGYAFMVLDGAYGDGSRSARRHRGFEKLPMSNHPVHRPDGDWYPPSGIPAPTVVDIVGDDRPEIVAALPGGKVYAVGPDGDRLWTADYAPRRAKTFASEVVAADLNKDGRPELVFGTYALHRDAGRLVVLSAKGKKLSVTRLRHQGQDGNGIGVAGCALDRRPHRQRHPRDRADDLRPRRRRLHRSRLRHRLPALADRAWQRPPRRHRTRHGAVTAPRTVWSAALSGRVLYRRLPPWRSTSSAPAHTGREATSTSWSSVSEACSAVTGACSDDQSLVAAASKWTQVSPTTRSTTRYSQTPASPRSMGLSDART